MSKRKRSSVVTECIFCGGTPLSEEHVISRWISEKFPNLERTHSQHGHFIKPLGQTVSIIPHMREFNRPLNKKTRKVVCEPCNNTWMSSLESRAQKILEPLMLGNIGCVEQAQQETIATWITLKSIIWEYTHTATMTVTSTDKKEFYTQKLPLQNWTIWLGWYGDPFIINKISKNNTY